MDRTQNAAYRGIPEDPLTRRAALRGVGALGVSAVLGARGTGRAVAQAGTPVASPAAEAYPEVVITATDYRLELPASIPGGPTRLTLENDGAEGHDAMFLRVNEGATLADLQAALKAPDFGPIFAAATSLGGPEVDAGLRATTIVDLQLGQYMVICIVPDAAGTPHYLMGMQAPVDVTAPASSEPAPAADATIELVEFGFGKMPGQVAPGRHVWKVANVGEQVHELLIMRQAPGVTFDQVQAMLQAAPEATPASLTEATPEATPQAAGPPPFTLIAGAAPMSPGQTNWLVLDLEAGEHFAICFLPDPATGAPPFALGMIMPFSVG
jgi:hypothetical protein